MFGAIHLFFIWNGDILTLYAVCGLLLLPVLNLSWPALLAIGAALIASPEFVSFGLHLPSRPAAEAAIEQARQIYGNGGFLAILKFRWRESWALIVPLLIQVLPRTAGLMLWGVAAWRSGVLRDAGRHRRKLLFGVVIGASLGGAITLNDVWAASSGKALWPALRHTHLDASILLALAYVLGVAPVAARPARHVSARHCAVGRMALTIICFNPSCWALSSTGTARTVRTDRLLLPASACCFTAPRCCSVDCGSSGSGSDLSVALALGHIWAPSQYCRPKRYRLNLSRERGGLI